MLILARYSKKGDIEAVKSGVCIAGEMAPYIYIDAGLLTA
jgi:hypothetical protein